MEKIKDFFTKLLDAVRSVIEGQGTLNTTARAGQKAAQQVPVLDDFFNALDNAIDNRLRMLDGEQRNTTDDKSSIGIRFSKDLDQYPYDMQTVIKEYLFFKKTNGTYYVAESIVDSKWKKAWVTSVYINKNRHGYLSTNMAVTPHQFTPETPLRSPVSANTNVPQNESGVNTHPMQKGQKNAQNGGSNTHHSLEVDRQGNALTEVQQVPVLDDFFNALDKPLTTANACWTVTRE